MIPLRNRVLQCRFGQRLTLTQKPTQAAIDKSGMRTRGRRPLGRFNGLIHKCESLVRGVSVRPGQRQGALHNKASDAGDGVRVASSLRNT